MIVSTLQIGKLRHRETRASVPKWVNSSWNEWSNGLNLFQDGIEKMLLPHPTLSQLNFISS